MMMYTGIKKIDTDLQSETPPSDLNETLDSRIVVATTIHPRLSLISSLSTGYCFYFDIPPNLDTLRLFRGSTTASASFPPELPSYLTWTCAASKNEGDQSRTPLIITTALGTKDHWLVI